MTMSSYFQLRKECKIYEIKDFVKKNFLPNKQVKVLYGSPASVSMNCVST